MGINFSTFVLPHSAVGKVMRKYLENKVGQE